MHQLDLLLLQHARQDLLHEESGEGWGHGAPALGHCVGVRAVGAPAPPATAQPGVGEDAAAAGALPQEQQPWATAAPPPQERRQGEGVGARPGAGLETEDGSVASSGAHDDVVLEALD